MWKRWIILPALLLAFVFVGNAQQQTNQARAARLSYVTGKVTVDGPDGPVDGQINMPMLEGQRITTGDDGQAEVEFEDGSVVRLVPSSSAVLNQMALNGQRMTTEVGLLNGQFYLVLRASDDSQYVVDAAGERIAPIQNSVVRVRMDEPPAEIGVFDGQVRVSRDSGFQSEVHAGESLKGDAQEASRYFLSQSIPEDSWDQWNTDREQQAANDASLRTDAQGQVGNSAEGYGWSDLDTYGDWYDLPGEGQVWQPEVATEADFDPYGAGSWVYYPGAAGYVWVSSYPWGWTPFRCGFWNYYPSFGWGWVPTGCSTWGGGWGGYGGVYIRVNRPPVHYRPPVRPAPGRGPGGPHWVPPHRIIHVGPINPPRQLRVANREGTPKVFNNHVVRPLPRQNGFAPRNGNAIGSTFKRDYRVNNNTRQPEMGVQPTQPGATIVPGAGWRAVGGENGRTPIQGGVIQNGGQNRPQQNVPVNRPQPGNNSPSRPGAQPPVQVQRPTQNPQQQPQRPGYNGHQNVPPPMRGRPQEGGQKETIAPAPVERPQVPVQRPVPQPQPQRPVEQRPMPPVSRPAPVERPQPQQPVYRPAPMPMPRPSAPPSMPMPRPAPPPAPHPAPPPKGR